MTLIKVNQTYLNFDRVTALRDLSTRDAAGNVTRGLLRVEFGYNQSVDVMQGYAALSAWLNANATTVTSGS